MCNLPSHERYLGCGCTINTGFKYSLQRCDAPNGIPFPDPEIFRREPGRVPGRCCDEERWTLSEIVMPGVCPRCEHDRIVRLDGPGILADRVLYKKCGHIKFRLRPATFHEYCRYNPARLRRPRRARRRSSARTQQGPNEGPGNIDSEEEQPKVACYYSRPEQKKNFSASDDALKEWQREKRAWRMDTERLQNEAPMTARATNEKCGNCDRAGWMFLWDGLMMDDLDPPRTGFRGRAPRGIALSTRNIKYSTDKMAVRCSPEPEEMLEESSDELAFPAEFPYTEDTSDTDMEES